MTPGPGSGVHGVTETLTAAFTDVLAKKIDPKTAGFKNVEMD